MRKIFSAPLRPFVQQREKIWIFNPFPISWSSALGERGEKRRIIQGGYFCGDISPFCLRTFSFFFSPNCFFLPSFPIPDNARARFPARLPHIKRQQCLNPFIIFPPRVLSISPSKLRLRLPSRSPPPTTTVSGPSLSSVCALGTREYKQFRQTRAGDRLTHSATRQTR